MLRKILVPLDGSGLAERALEDASALSVPTAATLVLLRAVKVRTPPGGDAAAAQAEAIADAESYLQTEAARLAHRGFTSEIVPRYGSAADCIQEEATLRNVDLVAMSTHGRSGPGRWIFGSVAEAVLARSSVPVLLVRAWQPRERPLLLEDQPRLLVPLDGWAFSESVLSTAAALADDLGAELILTRVQPLPKDVLRNQDGVVVAYVDEQEATLVSEATAYLEAVASKLAKEWPEVPVSTLARIGDPAECITKSAIQRHAAMIVMATHGRTGLARSVMGSVAARIVEHSTTSLVLVRPPNLQPVVAAEGEIPERSHV